MNDTLREHYRKLLSLEKQWKVAAIDLKLEDKRVEIRLIHESAQRVKCPECGGKCSVHDHAPERQWRHLDTMQFETILCARLPRANCPECGVKTITVPWAGKHGRFTLLFEAFAIDVIRASSSIEAACGLLNLDWSAADRIMKNAVTRGLARRNSNPIEHLGIDEKSFRSGHRYISLWTCHLFSEYRARMGGG